MRNSGSTTAPPRWIPAFLGILVVLASCWTPSAADCPLPSLFYPFSTYATPGPSAVVIDDFNTDGVPDVAVANLQSDSISVLLGVPDNDGKGTGAFEAPLNAFPGPGPADFVTADFNQDGVVDLAVANYSSNRVSILLGQGTTGRGDGRFALLADYPVGTSPSTLVVGEFNGDGISDMAVGNEVSGDVTILLGQGIGGVGDGTFYHAGTYTVSPAPYAIVKGHFNRDRVVDLAVSGREGHVTILLGGSVGGAADGTFVPVAGYHFYSYPFDVAASDLDDDGITDLVAAGTFVSSGQVRVLKGVGDGTFVAYGTYSGMGVILSSLLLADLNGDNIKDLAIAEAQSQNVHVLLGLGLGAFGTPIRFSATGVQFGARTVAAGDFNGDGAVDLVVCGLGVKVLLGTCPRSELVGPRIRLVRDVPNDQGGHVFVAWDRSPIDRAGMDAIVGYRVWRRMPLGVPANHAEGQHATISSRLVETRVVTNPDGSTALTYWEALATLPAERREGYAYAARTTQDSLPGSNPYTAFSVTALTPKPLVFYESNVDSGYSVDNLPPRRPSRFEAEYATSTVTLRWGVNTERDLWEYRLYRGNEVTFVPGPSNLVYAGGDTLFVDGAAEGRVYKLSAVDIHHNASRYALATPRGSTTSVAFAIRAQAEPNRVRLTWYVIGLPGAVVQVYRLVDNSGWNTMATLVADAVGMVSYEDAAVSPGQRIGYRLGTRDGDVEMFSDETWVTIPEARLALLGMMPNPATAGQDLVSRFSLPHVAAAALQVLDVAGRLVTSLDLASLGPGVHETTIPWEATRAPGVYWLRLIHGGKSVSGKFAVLR